MALTKQDIRAIRNADSLVFYHNTEFAGERGNWLKAGLDADHSSTGFDQEQWIQLDSTSIRTYEGGMGELRGDYPTKGLNADQVYGAVVLLHTKFRMEVQTWTKALREGDALAVEFLVGNNNDGLRKAGLSHDEAWLTIHRDIRDQSLVAVGKYMLDDIIADVWSPVRMVRPLPVRV